MKVFLIFLVVFRYVLAEFGETGKIGIITESRINIFLPVKTYGNIQSYSNSNISNKTGIAIRLGTFMMAFITINCLIIFFLCGNNYVSKVYNKCLKYVSDKVVVKWTT